MWWWHTVPVAIHSLYHIASSSIQASRREVHACVCVMSSFSNSQMWLCAHVHKCVQSLMSWDLNLTHLSIHLKVKSALYIAVKHLHSSTWINILTNWKILDMPETGNRRILLPSITKHQYYSSEYRIHRDRCAQRDEACPGLLLKWGCH